MKEIQWQQIGDRYFAELQFGRVAIVPTDPPNPYRSYTASIETKSGQVVATDSFDLEGCKIWAEVNLPLMDQVPGRLDGCGNVLQTLEICQRLISQETDTSHWLRIEHIKAWMSKYTGQPYDVKPIPVMQYSGDTLDWIEDGKTFYTETLFGKAVIQETREKGIIGGGIRHKAKIIHRSGATLDCYSFIDFMEAEYALKECLSRLHIPTIDESYLDYVHFTLDFCSRILPEDTDPIHYARLSAIDTEIHLTLD